MNINVLYEMIIRNVRDQGKTRMISVKLSNFYYFKVKVACLHWLVSIFALFIVSLFFLTIV